MNRSICTNNNSIGLKRCLKTRIFQTGKNLATVTSCLIVLMLGLMPYSPAYATTHALGTPSVGLTYWTANCAACHGTPQPTSATSAFSNVVIGANTTNMLAYYATNPANMTTATSAGGPGAVMAAGNITKAQTNQNDLSAYFASLMTPAPTNPGPSTWVSGATYSYQIVSASTSDYLVSTTTFAASATGITFTVGASGAVTATLPTVTTPTNYTVTLSATNAAAATPTGTVTFTLTVNPAGVLASQTITFGAAPTLAIGGTGTVSATGGASGNPVMFTSQTAGICTVSGTNGSTVTGVSSGTCTIAANQAGNTNYAAAQQVTQNISVALPLTTAGAAAMQVNLNTPVILDLAPFITGVAITGVNIVSAPAHGTATVNGTKVTYTPINNYFGTDSFKYTATGSGGTSQPGVVTVTIIGRPDPGKDTNVTGLINIQTETAKRFRQTQMLNFQQRLESRHHAEQSGKTGLNDSADKAPSMNMIKESESVVGCSTQNCPQPVRVAQLNDSMQAYEPNDWGSGSLTSVFGGTMVTALTTSTVNLAALTGDKQSTVGDSEELEIWGAGNLRFGTKSQAGSADIDFTTNGASLGMDRRFGEKLTLGMGIGYARDKSTIGLDGTGSKSNGNSVSTYASYQATPTTFIDGLLGYGTLNFNSTRYVTAFNDFARTNRSGSQTFGSLATGYEYRAEGLLLSPYARYDVAIDRLNAATETGAAALNYASQSSQSRQISLGMRAESQHQTGYGIALPHARIEYQRQMAGASQTTIAYADLSSSRYNLVTSGVSTNSLLFGVGSEFLMRSGWNLDINYQRLHSAGGENNQAILFWLSKGLD